MPPTSDLRLGDCLVVLKTLPDASVDAIVTDPPYGLSDHSPEDVRTALRCWLEGKPYLPRKGAKGFMGRQWDAFVPGPEVWKDCIRVLKPGGHLLVFAGTRTQDLMGIAVRLGGFDARDTVMVQGILHWVHGQGFPKSHDVSKAIDSMAGAERDVVGEYKMPPDATSAGYAPSQGLGYGSTSLPGKGRPITAPATPSAKQWDGWGTALKPSQEPILVFRKPLDGTVAKNALKYGTGAMNIDGCRVHTGPSAGGATSGETAFGQGSGWNAHDNRPTGIDRTMSAGRWPANTGIIHTPGCRQVGTKTVPAPVINRFDDGMKPFGEGAGHPYTSTGGGTEDVPTWECTQDCPVKALDSQSGIQKDGAATSRDACNGYGGGWGSQDYPEGGFGYGGEGGASRFFPTFGYSPDDDPRQWECTPDCPVRALDDQSGNRPGCQVPSDATCPSIYRPDQGSYQAQGPIYPDDGGASRFFPTFGYDTDDCPFLYCAKANDADRSDGTSGNQHPTVKPRMLLQWLVRLVTRKGGTVLDPFMGSGTTGVACMYEGMNFIGIEQDETYVAIARQRISYHDLKARGGVVNPFTGELPKAQESTDQKAGSLPDLFDMLESK